MHSFGNCCLCQVGFQVYLAATGLANGIDRSTFDAIRRNHEITFSATCGRNQFNILQRLIHSLVYEPGFPDNLITAVCCDKGDKVDARFLHQVRPRHALACGQPACTAKRQYNRAVLFFFAVRSHYGDQSPVFAPDTGQLDAAVQGHATTFKQRKPAFQQVRRFHFFDKIAVTRTFKGLEPEIPHETEPIGDRIFFEQPRPIERVAAKLRQKINVWQSARDIEARTAGDE